MGGRAMNPMHLPTGEGETLALPGCEPVAERAHGAAKLHVLRAPGGAC